MIPLIKIFMYKALSYNPEAIIAALSTFLKVMTANVQIGTLASTSVISTNSPENYINALPKYELYI